MMTRAALAAVLVLLEAAGHATAPPPPPPSLPTAGSLLDSALASLDTLALLPRSHEDDEEEEELLARDRLWYATHGEVDGTDTAHAYKRLGLAIDCFTAGFASGRGRDPRVAKWANDSAACYYAMGVALQDLDLHAASAQWYRRSIRAADEVRVTNSKA